MSRKATSPLIVTPLVLFFLVSWLGAASANHEVGHYEFELEENYYDYLLLSFEDDVGVEITLSSNKNIDVLLLTPEMFNQCCSDTELQEYEYLEDGGSALNVDEYSYVIENGVGPRYIIFDHTSEPNGGANPSGTVTIELTLTELPENLFEFHWQNLILSLIFIPLALLLVIESVKPGMASGLLRHETTLTLKKQILNSRTPMTYALIFVNSLFFILRAIFSPEEDNLLEYVEWGAMASGSVLDGNFFSILTSNFFHFDIIHLGMNMFFLYILGRYMEPKYGSMRFFGILLFGGFVASILSIFYDPYVASGGASGMVWCAFGVVLMERIFDQINSTKYKFCQWHDMQWFWGTLVLNAFVSFLPGVSFLGHFGGLLGGMGIIFAMVKLGTHPEPRKDQLIQCQICDFSFPVLELSGTELNNCPKCGQVLTTSDSIFPGWSQEIVQSFLDKGWTEIQLAEYYQEQLKNTKLDSNHHPEQAIEDSEE